MPFRPIPDRARIAVAIGLTLWAVPLVGQSTPASWVPRLLGAQATFIGQSLLPFSRSPYSGPNSLVSTGDQGVTDTYGLYFGSRLGSRLTAYLDLEMARGSGVSHATGLAGVTNGDVIRQGTADLSQGPYLARLFVRYTVPLDPSTVPADRAQDQLPGQIPARRLELDAGKFAASDFFDLNRYANSTRTQFLNWGLFQNSAWDFAADTRGYTYGVVATWVGPRWSARLGEFTMPRRANGNDFDWDIGRAHGDNLEVEFRPPGPGTIIRVLAYHNAARMGDYRDAIAEAPPATAPDIVADDRPGRDKYGMGLNLEQPIAAAGETGAFLRAGWDDGATESFAFTEVDRHLSTGVQIAGGGWGRADDRIGAALLLHGLSAPHQDYLAAGGAGFLLGDGRLNYGPERIAECYYRMGIGKYVQITPDIQLITNPGYNRDRGPATVLTLRASARY